MCPLCLHGFSQDQIAQLTWEHAPPNSLGGHPVALTCLRCNQRGGGPKGVDTHAKREDDYRRFLKADLDRPVVGAMERGTSSLHVEARASESRFLIMGRQKGNKPERLDEFREAWDRVSGPMPSFSLRVPKLCHFPYRARVSWLKSAYVVAFATLGYRYVFRTVFDPIREQIDKPDSGVLSNFFVDVSSADSANEIALVLEPNWLRGVAVRMRSRLVLLPFLDDARDFYKRISEHQDQQARLQGMMLEWPRRPTFILDTDPELRRCILDAMLLG